MSFIFGIITGWLIVAAVFGWLKRAVWRRVIAALKTPPP